MGIISRLSPTMNLVAFLCIVAVVVSEVHGGYGGYGGLLGGGFYGGYGPFLGGYGGLFGGFPYFGYGGYGGKGGYGYGGSRYKRSTDSYTDAQHSPVTHYSPAVHVVHSKSYADASPVHYATHHASPEPHVYNAVPASRTVHVSGHFSPAVVYGYPKHHGGSYGNTYPSYGYTSTPSYGYTIASYGPSYEHSIPSHSIATGHALVPHAYSIPSHSTTTGHASSYGTFTHGHNIPSY